MKEIKLIKDGVIRSVPVNNEAVLNDLGERGFVPMLKNGKPVITERNINKGKVTITNEAIRNALGNQTQTPAEK